jgi:hypothetical protein
MLNEKEEQLKALANAHIWGLKESIASQHQKKIEHVALTTLYPKLAETFL